MVYKGTVKNGVVVLADGQRLPDGTQVTIEPLPKLAPKDKAQPDFVREALEIAKGMEGLPSDLARNHDHYLYGRPKR